MALPRELTTRENDHHGSELGDIIRQLASDEKGHAFAALCAMARKLEKYGCSFLDLADHVENGGGSLNGRPKKKNGRAIQRAPTEEDSQGGKGAGTKKHGA